MAEHFGSKRFFLRETLPRGTKENQLIGISLFKLWEKKRERQCRKIIIDKEIFFCLSLFLPTLPTYSSRLYWPLFITENAVNHLRSCVFLLQPVQRSTLDVNQPVRFSLKIKLNFLKPQSVHLTSSTIVLRTQNLKTASSTPILCFRSWYVVPNAVDRWRWRLEANGKERSEGVG